MRDPKKSFHATKEYERQIQNGIGYHFLFSSTKNYFSHAAGIQRKLFKSVQPQDKMIESTQKLESPLKKVSIPPKKLEFQKKRNSNYSTQNLHFFTGEHFLLNPRIAKIHEISPAIWVVYRHRFQHFIGFSVQGEKNSCSFLAVGWTWN